MMGYVKCGRAYFGWSQMNFNVYCPLLARWPCSSCLTAGICAFTIQPNCFAWPSKYTATAGQYAIPYKSG